MVGHRYAIIVPEVRGIRRATRYRRSHSANPSHFRSFLFSFFSPAHSQAYAHAGRRENPFCRVSSHLGGGATRVDGTPVCPVVATGRPAALEPVEIGGGSLPAYALALSHAETS